jgi:hypothetical protein
MTRLANVPNVRRPDISNDAREEQYAEHLYMRGKSFDYAYCKVCGARIEVNTRQGRIVERWSCGHQQGKTT